MNRRRRLQRRDYTVGWICALPIELAAAQEMLDEWDEPISDSIDPIIYTLGRIGVHNVVLACLPAGNTGTQSAATVAARMRSRFTSIRFGLMVGIGGGVPSVEMDIRLGDVVISQPYQQHGGVVQYDFGKTEVGGNTIRTGWLNAPPPVLLSAIVEQRARHIRRQSAMESYLSKFKKLEHFNRDAAGPDVLFEATYDHVGKSTCEFCSHEMRLRRPPRSSPGVGLHYGTIASGNRVMKDGAARDKISKELGGVMCFEMEAAGLMNDFPCLVIRGICDYADSHKNKKWQPYAAATAAACAKEILSIIPGVPKAPDRRSMGTSETVQTRIEMKLDQFFQELRLGFKSPSMFTQNLEKDLVDDNITEVDVEENRDLIKEWIENTPQEKLFHESKQADQQPHNADADTAASRSQQHITGMSPRASPVHRGRRKSYDEEFKDRNDWFGNSSDDSLSNAETEIPHDDVSLPPSRRQASKTRAGAKEQETSHPRRYPSPVAQNDQSKPLHTAHSRRRRRRRESTAEKKKIPREYLSPLDVGPRHSYIDEKDYVRDSFPQQPKSIPVPAQYEHIRRHDDINYHENFDYNVNYRNPERYDGMPAQNNEGHQYGTAYYPYPPYSAYAPPPLQHCQGKEAKPDQNERQPPSFSRSETRPFDFSNPESIFSEFLRESESLSKPSHKSPEPLIAIVEKPLLISLEDIFKGCTKKLKVNRKLYDPTTGRTLTQDRILEVPIKRGLMKGSKIKFSGVGDQIEGRYQDLHFIIDEKPHPLFTRDSNDIHHTVEIDLMESLCGWSRIVETIDRKRLAVAHSGPTPPDWQERFPSLGMPKSKNPVERGDHVVNVKIKQPKSLTDDQKSLLRAALNGVIY